METHIRLHLYRNSRKRTVLRAYGFVTGSIKTVCNEESMHC